MMMTPVKKTYFSKLQLHISVYSTKFKYSKKHHEQTCFSEQWLKMKVLDKYVPHTADLGEQLSTS